MSGFKKVNERFHRKDIFYSLLTRKKISDEDYE